MWVLLIQCNPYIKYLLLDRAYLREQFLTFSYSGILEISRMPISMWVGWSCLFFPIPCVSLMRIVKLKATPLALALVVMFIAVMFVSV